MTEGDSWLLGGKRKSLKGTCSWVVHFIREGANSLALRLVPLHAPVRSSPTLEHRGPSIGLPVGLAAGLHCDQGHGVAGILPTSNKAFHKTFYCIFPRLPLSFGSTVLT